MSVFCMGFIGVGTVLYFLFFQSSYHFPVAFDLKVRDAILILVLAGFWIVTGYMLFKQFRYCVRHPKIARPR